MNENQAIDLIRKNHPCKLYLDKAPNNPGSYICPACHRDRVFLTDQEKFWNCPDCGEVRDVIDAAAYRLGLNRADTIKELASSYFDAEVTDFSAYFAECAERLADPDALAFLEANGISKETAEKCGIGYDPEADPGMTGKKAQGLIVPTSGGHYCTWNIRNGIRLPDPVGTTPDIFNESALYSSPIVFVADDVFTALSIIEAGCNAIALPTKELIGRLKDQLDARRPNATLILNLEQGMAGSLSDTLKRLNMKHTRAALNGKYETPNAFLIADKDGFVAAVKEAQRKAGKRPDNVQDYIEHFIFRDMMKFNQEISTGFPDLDKQSGGLYAGLYVLAAISSLGKTTLAVQIAEQIAASGKDVLYFSLEQSKLEMVAKGIARRTVKNGTGVSSLAVRKGAMVGDAYRSYTNDLKDRFSIIEGNFGCTPSFIGKYVRDYIDENGVRPVVFVDYLQIIQPDESTRRQTAREAIDATVTELKRLSRELELTLFVISSVNRANYLTPIGYESLKESGGIEYTADVIWGLQLEAVMQPGFEGKTLTEKREEIDRAKREEPRKVVLNCIKNRYGIANYKHRFEYFPKYDLFKDKGAVQDGNDYPGGYPWKTV